MKILVEVFSAQGCSKCAHARDALKLAVDAFGQDAVSWREVNIIEELDYAVDLGVITPPCIAIDGKLVFPKLPTAEALREELAGRIAGAGKP